MNHLIYQYARVIFAILIAAMLFFIAQKQTELDKQITKKENQYDNLLKRIEVLEFNFDISKNAAIYHSPVRETQNPENNSTPLKTQETSAHTQDSISGKETYRELAEYGYITNESWSTIDEKLKKMSKEENKIFWEQLTYALEKGEIYYAQ